jgi:CheY-like chemotaxis protein
MAVVLALVDDLMFRSRIQEAARQHGLEVLALRDAPAVLEACRAGARLVLLDLDSARLPWREVLEAVRDDADLGSVQRVGFFSHVHAERGRAARDAGCTTVLPRSAFVDELPALLERMAGASDETRR